MVLVLGPMALAADETREVKIEDLKLTVPASWKQQPPSNNLRLGQFEIPAAEGDKEPAELTIFNFGAGGGVKANIDRWVEQFQPDDRKTKSTQGKCSLGDYVLVDVSGTYKKPVGPPRLGKTEPMPGARMLGVILSVEKKGLYFLKLTGPEKTVAAAAGGIRTSIGAKAGDEKPWDGEN
jgi:gluconolactonase